MTEPIDHGDLYLIVSLLFHHVDICSQTIIVSSLDCRLIAQFPQVIACFSAYNNAFCCRLFLKRKRMHYPGIYDKKGVNHAVLLISEQPGDS